MKETIENSNEIIGIDILKFICAILVFIIHVSPFTSYLNIQIIDSINYCLTEGICRIAVPFFFTCSGYFLFKENDGNNSRIKKYILKILRLLGIWYAITYHLGNGHLWYLVSLIWAILIITLLLKLNIKKTSIFVLSMLLFIFGTLFESYYNLSLNFIRSFNSSKALGAFSTISYVYGVLFDGTTRNGLFMAPIFIMIGELISRKNIRLNKLKSYVGLMISLLILVFEVKMVKDNNWPKDLNMYFCLPIVSFFLFNVGLNIKSNRVKTCMLLRELSSLMFFSHMFIYRIIKLFFVDTIGIMSNSVIICCTSLFLTMLIDVLIIMLSKKEKYLFLKYLYT